MKSKTLSRLGHLRQGDRFYFTSDKKKKVYQLDSFSAHKANYNVVENDVVQDGWLFKKTTDASREVIFLRHTLLQPGDPCFLQDLKEGDIFELPDSKWKFVLQVKHSKEIKMAHVENLKAPFYTHPLTKAVVVSFAQVPQLN